MLTTNDVAYGMECSNILSFEDRVSECSGHIVKLNISPALVRDQKDLFFAVVKYLTIQESLSNIDTSPRSLERTFNAVVWQFLDRTDENIKKAAKAWVQFHEIYKIYIEMIQKADSFIPNLHFKKAVYKKKRISISSTIDLVLVEKNKLKMVTFSPYRSRHQSTLIVGNIDTLFGIDYLLEADLNLTSVVDIGIPIATINRDHIVNSITLDSYIKAFVQRQVSGICDPVVNIGHCYACPYLGKCNFKDLLHGRS